MAKARRKHANCSVVGCTDQHKSLFKVPALEKTRKDWIYFIFNGNPPETTVKNMHVCANHFKPECFINLGQYKAGLASKMFLCEGVSPTERGKAVNWEHVS